MSPSGSALVVANVADPDAGYVGERLLERGFRLSPVWREKDVPRQLPTGTDCVLLLGSDWSVAHPVAPDTLADECALVRAAGAVAVPVLGLCYGAQVIAHAYGGTVTTAARPEVGLVGIETSDPRLVPPGPWWAFHADVIEPPVGAELLASNSCGTQAFALAGALGVQFHPEVRPEVLADWVRRLPAMAATSGSSGPELVALAESRESEARAAAYALVDGFLERFGA